MIPGNLKSAAPRAAWLVPCAFFLANLAARLAFLDWHYATYTDSIDYMTALDRLRGTIILPAYPFAIDLLERLTSDPQLAGRLVSILAGALAVLPLFGLTRLVFGRRSAVLAGALYTVSPLIFRWSLRIFPHSLYSLFVLLFLYGLFRCLALGGPLPLILGVFAGGLALVTYPTGLILVPLAAGSLIGYLFWVAWRERRLSWGVGFLLGWLVLGTASRILSPLREQASSAWAFILAVFPLEVPGSPVVWEILLLGAIWGMFLLLVSFLLPASDRNRGWWWRRPLVLAGMAASLAGYWFLHYWQHSLAMSTWYQQGMQNSYRSLAGRWESWLLHYLQSFPYVLVYPVALAAAAGLVFFLVGAGRRRLRWGWLAFYLYFLVGVFYTLVVNKWWTPRYQYTLVVVTLPLAAHGLSLLFSRAGRIPGWLGFGFCFLASAVSTVFVLNGSRDSFADIRRSADYIRENLAGRRVYSSEIRKVGWWAKTPLTGYTRNSRRMVRPGDYVLLVGWHTNITNELRFLQRSFPLREVNREQVTVTGLLADDIVDWAGRRLRRRANDPVCWEQRFHPQEIESLIVEVLDPQTGTGLDEGTVLPAGGDGLLVSGTEHATYFDSGVWALKKSPEKGSRVVLEMAHARPGAEGAFRMVAYADEDSDGSPDRLVASSPLLKGEKAGQWSRWEFVAPGGPLFVGASWPLGSWIYYERGHWPDAGLGEVMFYSRGGIPRNRANPIFTNLKISRPESPGITPVP